MVFDRAGQRDLIIVNPSAQVLIVASEPGRSNAIASPLEALGLTVTRSDLPNQAAELIKSNRPALVVVVLVSEQCASDLTRVVAAARSSTIPTLAIVDATSHLADLVQGYDDWMLSSAIPTDLPIRAQRLVDRPTGSRLPAVDPRFLALVVHDLRTPLNVINLTIRAIGQSVPSPSPDFEEDLTFLHENSKQIERMLAQLGDYCRLVESEDRTTAVEFETRRFLTDFLEEKLSKRDSEHKSVRLELGNDAPAEVALDPNRVRLALQHALANAVAAAGDAPIKLRSRGPAGRWTIDIVVDKAPPPTTTAIPLQSHVFERMIGSPAERRGLDLAIAARVSELFGGSARLEVEPGVRSIISLDWPVRLAT